MPDQQLSAIIERNLARVRDRIAAAAARRGRDPAGVRLVAVTKYVSLDVIEPLIAAGVNDLGENRVQQLVARATAAPGRLDSPFDGPGGGGATSTPGFRWHMIGHLQRNKVRALLRICRVVHALDSARLADELQSAAAAAAAAVDVFVEVNVAGEAQKGGVNPQTLAELLRHVHGCPALRLRGLMAMAPLNPDAEAARPHFARLAALLREHRTRGDLPDDAVHLSMGMSQDFEVAVEEGATVVRVGSALYEGIAADG